jgi:hypothetical protein
MATVRCFYCCSVPGTARPQGCRFGIACAARAALDAGQRPPDQERPATEAAAAAGCEAETVQAWPHRISWARLLKRVFDIDMEHCPNCGGGELKIIAAILERPVIEKILSHLGLDPQPPPRGRVSETGEAWAH